MGQKKEGETKKERLEESTKSGEVAALRMKALPAILNAAKSGAWDSLDGDKGSPNPGDGQVKEPQCTELCLHILGTCVHSPTHMCTGTHSHTYVHAHTCTHVYTHCAHACVHAHSHICTCTHAHHHTHKHTNSNRHKCNYKSEYIQRRECTVVRELETTLREERMRGV